MHLCQDFAPSLNTVINPLSIQMCSGMGGTLLDINVFQIGKCYAMIKKELIPNTSLCPYFSPLPHLCASHTPLLHAIHLFWVNLANSTMPYPSLQCPSFMTFPECDLGQRKRQYIANNNLNHCISKKWYHPEWYLLYKQLTAGQDRI